MFWAQGALLQLWWHRQTGDTVVGWGHSCPHGGLGTSHLQWPRATAGDTVAQGGGCTPQCHLGRWRPCGTPLSWCPLPQCPHSAATPARMVASPGSTGCPLSATAAAPLSHAANKAPRSTTGLSPTGVLGGHSVTSLLPGLSTRTTLAHLARPRVTRAGGAHRATSATCTLCAAGTVLWEGHTCCTELAQPLTHLLRVTGLTQPCARLMLHRALAHRGLGEPSVQLTRIAQCL